MIGITTRDPVSSMCAPTSRLQRTWAEFSTRNASRSAPNALKPIPADSRWYVFAS